MKKLLFIIVFMSLTNTVFAERYTILFSSPSCGPCRILKKELAELPYKYYEIDITKNPQAVKAWKIKRLPTVIIADVNDGKTTVVQRWESEHGKDRLKTILKKFSPKKVLTTLRDMVK